MEHVGLIRALKLLFLQFDDCSRNMIGFFSFKLAGVGSSQQGFLNQWTIHLVLTSVGSGSMPGFL